jgi:membrane-associated protease RseP (regulator of RpoE activity)
MRQFFLTNLLGLLIVSTKAFQSVAPPSRSFTTTKPHYIRHSPSSAKQSSFTQLNAAPAAVGALAVLCGVVLVHESGHYLAARLFGVKVEEFSIGVGPKLAGFRALDNDFSLRALPLGGYVRFPEHYNTTLAQELEEEQMLLESMNETKWERMVSNVLSLGTYESMLQKIQERVDERQKETQPSWWQQVLKKDQPSQRTPKPSLDMAYYTDPDLLQNRPWPQRAVVIAGGVVFNIVLAFLIYLGQITSDAGLPKPMFDAGAKVTALPRPDAPAAGLLRPNDVIVAVNGMSLATATTRPSALASQKAISDVIATIRATPEGDSLQLSVVKAGTKNPVSVVVQPTLNSQNIQSIGALLGPNYAGLQRIHSSSLPQAVALAAECTNELLSDTANGLYQLGSTVLMGKGAPAGASISGPVGLIKTGSDVVATNNLAAVLAFCAAISINLAVINSLPLPALDGGQMVFVLVEALMGRQVDQKLQERITSVAILMLLALSVSTTVGDVENLFR